MSATLQPGAVCASLDNGQLCIVNSIADGLAWVRPIAGGALEPMRIDDLWPLMDSMP